LAGIFRRVQCKLGGLHIKKKGREEGREEGEINKAIEIAKNLLDVLE